MVLPGLGSPSVGMQDIRMNEQSNMEAISGVLAVDQMVIDVPTPVLGGGGQLLEAVEEATAQKDVTGLWASLDGADSVLGLQLSDDWLPQVQHDGLEVVRFGTDDFPHELVADEDVADNSFA